MATASVCSTVLVRTAHGHVEGESVFEGLAVRMSLGRMFFFTRLMMASPARLKSLSRSGSVARMERCRGGPGEGFVEAVHAVGG